MAKFLLSTDSCCDELKCDLAKKNIPYIPLKFTSDDENYEDNFTKIEEYDFFFNEEKEGKMFKTAGLSPLDVEEYFEKLLKEHKQDIVHFTLSSGLSCTYTVVQQIADDLNEKSKGPKIYVIDSKSATQGQRMLVHLARICRDKDMDAKSTYDFVTEKREKLVVDFFVNNLDHLKKGGRISPLQATVGKMLQLKPVIDFDEAGKLRVFDKVMGTKKVINYLIDRAVKKYDYEYNETFYIARTGNLELANILKEKLTAKIPNANVIIGFIGPVIAAHTGPHALGLVYIGK